MQDGAALTTDLREQLQSTLGATYTLEHELTGGGMARVFAATETALGRRVVVKVLPPELVQGVSVERFRREIQLAAQLQHPHIVPVHAAGEINGLPYYTMPLVDGPSLRARLANGGPLPISEAIGILRDVAKALAFAHERGVVHRDIKPDNVLLAGGSAVVTDFGVAKALSASKRSSSGSTLTQIGTSLGTPAYMAPEQAAGDPATDSRADVYAFGVMAYEMLAGRPPFHGRTPQQLLAAQMSEPPRPIGEVRPDTPPLLARLVMKCLEKEPDDRPQAASDLVRVLETVTSGGAHPAMPAILLGGQRRLARALGVYAAAFLAVALLTRAAVIAIGLPDWVFPGALILMALGLPVVLFTGYVHYATHRALTASAFTAPALTPGGTGGTPEPKPQGTLTTLAVRASPWVSWRRAAWGGVYALAAFVLLVGGFMLLRALGIGPAASLLAAGTLRDRGRLLVTDFRVRGADSAIGDAITEAVRTDLGQSAAVSIVSPGEVAAALTRMQRSATSRVDLGLAREIAAREGVKAIVDGDLTPLGAGFLMSVRLVAADSGTELASFREAADSPKELIPALDRLTRKLRGRIGESLKAVHASPPLEHVTTASLEALKQYAEGARANDVEGDFPKAVARLREAVALDTTFAEGWRKLGAAMSNAGMPGDSIVAVITRAYRYRDRLTERERDLAVARYYTDVSLDRPKVITAYEAVLRRDPTDGVALNNLGVTLEGRREFARAESLYSRSIQLGRAPIYVYGNIVRAQFSQGKLAQAERSLAILRERYPNNWGAPFGALLFLYARGRLDSMAALLARLRTWPEAQTRVRATQFLADLALLRGRLRESDVLQTNAIALDSVRGAPQPPLDGAIAVAAFDIWFLNQPARGVHMLDSALLRHPFQTLTVRARPYFRVATLYARAARPDRARAVLAQYRAEVTDTALRRWFEADEHTALGEVALAEHRPLEAVREFRLGDVGSDGPANDCAVCLPVALGRAFDQARLADSAIAYFEQYLTTPQWSRVAHWSGPSANEALDPTYLAGVYKRLGELYESNGDRGKAAAYYAKFVDVWKDADAQLQPQVVGVRRRLARLGGERIR
jgi:tetratricopeptide (TPR) repeat protein/tRNA A-37 threonylcarbamoyl transferase component Bud32